MTISGRYDAGSHRFFRRPPGKLTPWRKLGPGIDLKTHAGYTLHAPSIHPDTGKPYVLVDLPIAEPPDWLVELITPPPPPPPKPISVFWTQVWPGGDSIADSVLRFRQLGRRSRTARLDVHQLRPGLRWCGLAADRAHIPTCSATIRHGLLFVYSSETVFTVTEPSNPNGYTKFRAFAWLNHNKDMSAAARALREEACLMPQSANVPPAGGKVKGQRTITWTTADKVNDGVPTWAWEYGRKGRLMRATLVLFAGRPGAGKSTAAR